MPKSRQELERPLHHPKVPSPTSMPSPVYRQAYFRSTVPLSELSPGFGIVTSRNPFGRVLTGKANQNRTHLLREQLATFGLPHFPVNDGDREGHHLEHGFGIAGLDRDPSSR